MSRNPDPDGGSTFRRRSILTLLCTLFVPLNKSIELRTAKENGGTHAIRPEPKFRTTEPPRIDPNGSSPAFHDGSSYVGVCESTNLWAYTGDLSYYGITTDAISGSKSVVGLNAEHGSYRTIVSTSGLSSYPQAGDTFKFQIAADTKNTYGGVLWGVQSAESPWPCYRLRLDTGATPGVEFEKITTDIESHKNSKENKLAPWLHDNEDVRPKVGTAYTVTVEWRTDGVMPFTVEETETGTVLVDETDPKADTEYTDGGVGFMLSRSWDEQDRAKVRFDGSSLCRASRVRE